MAVRSQQHSVRMHTTILACLLISRSLLAMVVISDYFAWVYLRLKCDAGRAVAGKNAQYARSMQNGFDKMPEFPISPGSSNVKLAGVSFGPSGYQSQYADLSMNPQAMNLQHSIGNTTCQPPSPFMRSMSFGNQSTPERRLTVGAGRPTSSPQGIPTFQNFQPSYHATPTYTSAPRISTQDHMELVYSNMNMMMAARRLDEGLCNIQAGLVEISRNIHEIHKKNGIATAEELTGVQKLIQQQHAQAGLARSTSMRFVKDESNCSSIFDHQV